MDRTIHIRPCRHESASAVLELWRAAYGEPVVRAGELEQVERLITEASDALLVAEDDRGEIVGTLIATWDGWRGNMYRLAVDPQHRGRGVARLLIEAGHARLRARGARRITALVADEDDAAVRAWRSAGYERDERVGRFVVEL